MKQENMLGLLNKYKFIWIIEKSQAFIFGAKREEKYSICFKIFTNKVIYGQENTL